MKKLLAIALVLSMALSLAACTQAEAKSKFNTVEDIKKSGTLVMFTDARFAPFEYVAEGDKVVGVDADIAAAIAEALGVELKVINADFDGLSMAIQNGQADMAVAALTITEERAKTMDFSIPYTNACQYIIVQEGNTSVTCFDDLAGLKIGTQLGTTGDIWVSEEITGGKLKDTKAENVQYKTLQDGCLALASGKLDAIVVDDLSAKNYCAVNKGLKCFEALYKDGTIEQELYGVAVAKGNETLIAEINKVLEELLAKDAINQSLNKHIADSSIQ